MHGTVPFPGSRLGLCFCLQEALAQSCPVTLSTWAAAEDRFWLCSALLNPLSAAARCPGVSGQAPAFLWDTGAG